MIEGFELGRPWVLWALLLLPFYGALRRRAIWRDRVPHPPLQYLESGRRGPVRTLLRALHLPLELLLVAILILALASPHRTSQLELWDDEGVDIALVLDISLSMLATDFPPNRLEALRSVARDFIHRSGNHRLGVQIFAADSFVHTPLTQDHRSLLELLEDVSVYNISQSKSGGTAIGDALLVAGERLQKSKREGRDQAVVLITDGESNVGSDPVLGARYLHHLGIRLYIIGIGGEEPIEVFFEGRRVGGDDTPYLAFLDDTQLQQVAEVAEGRYYRATDKSSLAKIFAELSHLESAPLEARTVEVRQAYTSHLAFVALPLFALGVLLGGAVLRRPLR